MASNQTAMDALINELVRDVEYHERYNALKTLVDQARERKDIPEYKRLYKEPRHSHRHSPRRAKGLSHVTTKAKVIWELFYQKSYQLSHGQNALDNPKIMKSY